MGANQKHFDIPADEFAATQAHRSFLHGTPLSEEHAAVRDGSSPNKGHAKPKKPEIENASRELTNDERAALRELRLSDGWPVLLRLQEKIVQMHRAGAISKSQIDPLGNSDEIAREWAYVGMFRRACRELTTLVSAEVEREEE